MTNAAEPSISVNNSIYLQRNLKLYLTPGQQQPANTVYLAALLKNIESLGFTFSPELIKVAETLSVNELTQLYTQLVKDLRSMVGAYVNYEPMYPNFPKQVMEASEAELYLNAMLHYLGDWIGARILPKYEKKERAPLTETTKLKVIGLGSPEDFILMFARIAGAKTAISATDKEYLEWFVVSSGNTIATFMERDFPLKENIALLAGYILKHTTCDAAVIKRHFKTATDVLRLATVMSGGDVSLAENTKFRTFKKRERRMILDLLENCGSITADMLKHSNRWKRLGEKLHPFEYKKRFPKCFDAFDVVRNEKPFETFNSRIEASLLGKNASLTAALLKQRPGEFARRVDNLLRLSVDAREILNLFEQLAADVSSPVLLQVMAHFKNRNNGKKLRTFFPKGNAGKAYAIPNHLPALSEETCSAVVAICENTLIHKYSSLRPLGQVYIDDAMKNYTVPFALRSASKALKTISRGSRLPLPTGDTLRFFIWWRDGNDRTDIDLSAVALDENHAYKTEIAYYNLKSLGGYHSGDITSAPDGASEFIDIDIPAFLNAGIHYVVMSVNSFTEQPYCELPECFAGFMIRQHANSGEIYEPRTVENKFDLTANTRIAVPMIVDLKNREVYWADIALTRNLQLVNNVAGNMPGITITAKAITSLVKPSLYDLFVLHAKARGKLVADATTANTIFAVHNGIKPTDTEIIISEYL